MFLRSIVLLLLILPFAAAGPAVEPPTWNEASYDRGEDRVHLSWDGPQDATSFDVYQDGTLVASTTVAKYNTSANWTHAVFQVVAWVGDESTPPSLPLVATTVTGAVLGHAVEGWTDPTGDWIPCPVLRTKVNPDLFPYIFYATYPECLPAGKLIDNGPPAEAETAWT